MYFIESKLVKIYIYIYITFIISFIWRVAGFLFIGAGAGMIAFGKKGEEKATVSTIIKIIIINKYIYEHGRI